MAGETSSIVRPSRAAWPHWPIRWSIGAAIAIGLACLAALFSADIAAAVDVWNASTAYSHCYLIVPMALYLLWDRKDELLRSTARPEPGWALGAIPIALAWFAAERLGIMEGRQLAVIAAAELLLLCVLGRVLFARIAGPLLFLFFLVPFGAFLTPVLQRFTATFTIIGLNLLGIPNYSDNFVIETPSGTFFVAEACAGLRFLIAAVAFGVFYALLTYTSWQRRAVFIAASIVVPIIANGFRALGIVVLGQVLGSAEAAAADHIIYGWLFFSVVMILLIAAGQLFREAGPAVRGGGPAAPATSARFALWGAGVVVAVMAAGPIAAAAIGAGAVAPVVSGADILSLPDGCARGVAGPVAPGRWSMAIMCGTKRFDAEVSLFSPRSTSSALVRERRRVTQEIGAEDVAVQSVAGVDGGGRWSVVQTTDPDRVTAYASWIDGQPSGGGLQARLAQARDSVLGSRYSPALLTITAAEAPRSSPAARQATLQLLRALVAAQAGLDGRMLALTRSADSR